MLRITERFENDHTLRLRLDGTLSVGSYRHFADTMASHEACGSALIMIDMAGVGFMDQDSARRILMMPGDRVKVINCSPFIETLLATVEHERRVAETSKD
jgi:hypothetical protein